MTTSHDGQEVATGSNMEERRLELARLADLDVLTADDEEEIGRFQAFVAGPAQPRATSWLRPRRRTALPL